jgi:hypothetical protein
VYNAKNLILYVNPAYAAQLEKPYNATEADKLGWVNIPDQFHFWTILVKGGFYVLKGRRGIASVVVDHMEIDELIKTNWIDAAGNVFKPVEVVDGLYEKSYCLRMKLKPKPTLTKDAWILCFDSDKLRQYWVKSISFVPFFILVKRFEFGTVLRFLGRRLCYCVKPLRNRP